MPPKKCWLALLLNLAMLGGGYLYLNRIGRFFLILSGYLFTIGILSVFDLIPTFSGFIIFLLCSLAFFCIYIIDVIVIAKNTSRGNDIPHKFVILISYFIISTNITSGINMDAFRTNILGFNINHLTSDTMAPTINKGDVVLTDTRAYSKRSPTIGDIVLFHHCQKDYIRRIKTTDDQHFTVYPNIFPNFCDINTGDQKDIPIPITNIKGRITYLAFSKDIMNIGKKIM